VWVDVEGTQLTDEPTIEFVSVGPLSLRDLAVLRLDALTSPGGSFDQLLGNLDPSTDPGAAEVVQSKARALATLDILLQGDPQADDEAIKDLAKFSVEDLTAALADPGQVDTTGLELVIADLVEIARLVAQYWYDTAVEACAGQSAGASRLDQAELFLLNGDDAVAAEDWVGGSSLYGKSIEKSLSALTVCN
jgi:hypothetical protein